MQDEALRRPLTEAPKPAKADLSSLSVDAADALEDEDCGTCESGTGPRRTGSQLSGSHTSIEPQRRSSSN